MTPEATTFAVTFIAGIPFSAALLWGICRHFGISGSDNRRSQ